VLCPGQKNAFVDHLGVTQRELQCISMSQNLKSVPIRLIIKGNMHFKPSSASPIKKLRHQSHSTLHAGKMPILCSIEPQTLGLRRLFTYSSNTEFGTMKAKSPSVSRPSVDTKHPIWTYSAILLTSRDEILPVSELPPLASGFVHHTKSYTIDSVKHIVLSIQPIPSSLGICFCFNIRTMRFQSYSYHDQT